MPKALKKVKKENFTPKMILGSVALIIVVLGVMAGIVLVQTQQNIEPKAYSNRTNFDGGSGRRPSLGTPSPRYATPTPRPASPKPATPLPRGGSRPY